MTVTILLFVYMYIHVKPIYKHQTLNGMSMNSELPADHYSIKGLVYVTECLFQTSGCQICSSKRAW